ncbi:MAG TPA: hypothetical protein VFG04_03170 [Planctomycetaceae bacterium]|jgi:hypothetical protein|nr:hypothetical protein [Planctomycetaceae bacterium]
MTTFSGQVSQSSDDSDQVFGVPTTNSLTSASINLKNTTASKKWAGFRFQNVTVPAGATITAASLSLWCPTGGNTAMFATIFGNKVANPGTLQATSNYLASLAQTTASTFWSATLSTNQFNASPDISAIITELIGQAGWASANSMVFPVLAGSSSQAATIEMWDGTPSQAAELSITYTGGGGGASIVVLALWLDPMRGGFVN